MSDDLVRRIQGVRFTPVRIREGYDMSEVDNLLDDLVDAVTNGHPVRPLVDAARFTPVRLREGYDMGDVDSFLASVVAEADPDGTPPVAAAVTTSDSPAGSVVQEQRGLLSRWRRSGR